MDRVVNVLLPIERPSDCRLSGWVGAWLAFSWLFGSPLAAQQVDMDPFQPWTVERANRWYDQLEWPVGANFVPSTAVNQLEMWQAETFDPETMDRELGWAADAGLNTMRVFLHDLPWKEDREGFFQRVDRYLDIADRHGIRTMFVLFDGVWDPFPKSGPQPDPVPGVHNSGWVQSPGRAILEDPDRHDELRPYVTSVIQRYADDRRVLIWDLFNEPNNANRNSYGVAGTGTELPPAIKQRRAAELVAKAFTWARGINPSQPLTVGLWGNLRPDAWTDFQQMVLDQSDIVTFHAYAPAPRTESLVERLLQMGRPLMCTEYMARGSGSTFEAILPIFHQHRVGAYHWGLVNGRSQTIYPWDSWQQASAEPPETWFHDLFRNDGQPYRPAEVRLIRRLSSQPMTQPRTRLEPAPADEPGSIRAALRDHDRAVFVKEGWIRDPFIARGADGNYYLTGTQPTPGDSREEGDPYNIGLGTHSIVGAVARVWKSEDLVTWEELPVPFTLEDGVWADVKPEAFARTPKDQWYLWAPELHWLGDRWALVHTSPSPVKGANLSLTQGAAIEGPWENPMGAAIQRRHDPSLFQDDDGSCWMIWGATRIARLQPDFSGFAGPPVAIGPAGDAAKMGHEGCLIMKIEDKYVLFGTGWSTGKMRRGSYNLYYATADQVTGPYGERQFAGRFLGHGTPFQDDRGRWWCTAFFNANIPPLPRAGIEQRDLQHTAQTINRRGTTLVPLEVRTEPDGSLTIRAKDPAYATPGPDEAQSFPD